MALVPLRAALGWFDVGGRGLAAREAAGTLWRGALKEAQFGRVPLGDVVLTLVRHRGEHRIRDSFCSVAHLTAWAKAGGRWR